MGRIWGSVAALLLQTAAVYGTLSGPCRKETATYGWVCRCNSFGCDSVPASDPKPGIVDAFISSKAGGPLEASNIPWSQAIDSDADIEITIDPRVSYQEILGFGGAFTDAAGMNIGKLPSALVADLLGSYFDPFNGSAYSIGRIPIASCDFSTHEYSYDDVSGDLALQHWALAPEDRKFKIPYIKAALALSRGNLRLFGSPWSAPGWMKTNGKMNGRGHLLGQAGDSVHKTWAKYLIKFLEAYGEAGIPIWAMTVQNEPSTGFVPKYSFQTMGFSAAMERDFVKLDLGPMLAASPHNGTKIIILDDQRFFVTRFTKTVLADPDAAKYVSGVGLHWYEDGFTPIGLLDIAHKNHPEVFYLATEACAGSLPWEKRGVTLGNWARAEQYAHSVIGDLNHWVGGWVDWNLALSPAGGPNWVKNVVDAPVIVADDGRSFAKQPMFYALAHFAKFIPRGSRRVGVKTQGKIEALAAVTPSGGRVLVLLNRADEAKVANVAEAGRQGGVPLSLPAHSITTLHWTKQ